MRLSSFNKRISLCDYRLDFLVLKKGKQSDQILPKLPRLYPFERLDAIRDHPLPAGQKPVANDVPAENGGLKWQVELTQVAFVGSLMPSNPLRGVISVVTPEGVWNSSDKPQSIWGFLLTAKETSFLASRFEAFEYLHPAELPSDIRMSLPQLAPEHPVLALTILQNVVNTSAQANRDRLASVEETLFLVEDIA